MTHDARADGDLCRPALRQRALPLPRLSHGRLWPLSRLLTAGRARQKVMPRPRLPFRGRSEHPGQQPKILHSCCAQCALVGLETGSLCHHAGCLSHCGQATVMIWTASPAWLHPSAPAQLVLPAQQQRTPGPRQALARPPTAVASRSPAAALLLRLPNATD